MDSTAKKDLVKDWFERSVLVADSKTHAQYLQLINLSEAGYNLSKSEALSVVLEKAPDVSVGLVASYLYDKLK